MKKLLVLVLWGIALAACGSGGSASCESVGETMCARACDCGTGFCKISQGGATVTFPSEAACRALYVGVGCQGPQPSVASLSACQDSLDQASCRQGALEVPSSCDLGDAGDDEPDARPAPDARPGGNPDAGNTGPATVVSRTPAPGATDVAVSAMIVVTFSAEMDTATLTTTSFTLRPTGGAPVEARVTTAPDRATLVPMLPLLYDTAYQVRVEGARDRAGHVVTVPEWTIRTVRRTDTGAPYIVTERPWRDEKGVLESAKVTVTFSENMAPQTVSATTLTLARGGAPVTATVTIAGAVATLTPSAPLVPDTVYDVTVTTGVKDTAGNAMTSPVTWSFTTVDRTPPVIVERTPAQAATNVGRDTAIRLFFDEHTTVPDGGFVVTGASTIPGELDVYYDVPTARHRYTFVPDTAWEPGQKITVTIAGAKDLNLNTAAPLTWSFTVSATEPLGTASELPEGKWIDAQNAVAVDGLGNGFALFSQSDGVWASRYSVAAGRWDPAAHLTTRQPLAHAAFQRVVTDAQGRAIAIWRDYYQQEVSPSSFASRQGIAVSQYLPGGDGWSAARRISVDGADVDALEVAMNAAGAAVIIYEERRDVNGERTENLYALRYRPATGWGMPELLSPLTLFEPIDLTAGIDATGRATVMWLRAGGIYVASAADGAAFGAAVKEVTPSLTSVNDLRTAVLPDGSAVALWYGSSRIQTARRSAAGVWTTPETLAEINVTQYMLSLAANASGEAVAMWHDYKLELARLGADGKWTRTTVDVQTADDGNVTIDESGRATAVFTAGVNGSGLPFSVYGMRYEPGVGWGKPGLLETSNLTVVKKPAVATNGAGATFATWGGWDGASGFRFK